MSEWMNDWMNEWMNENIIEQANNRTNEGKNERKKYFHDCQINSTFCKKKKNIKFINLFSKAFLYMYCLFLMMTLNTALQMKYTGPKFLPISQDGVDFSGNLKYLENWKERTENR